MPKTRSSCPIDQEAAVGGGPLHGQPPLRGEDGAGVHLHAAGRARRHLEGDPLRRHEGELHLHHCQLRDRECYVSLQAFLFRLGYRVFAFGLRYSFFTVF